MEDCDLIEEITCNTLEDLEYFNCKLEECEDFDDMQVECTYGECKNISQAYNCQFQVTIFSLFRIHSMYVTKGAITK